MESRIACKGLAQEILSYLPDTIYAESIKSADSIYAGIVFSHLPPELQTRILASLSDKEFKRTILTVFDRDLKQALKTVRDRATKRAHLTLVSHK